ncbi:unnamed protein product [Ascophyllum nodosum]
MAEKAIQAEDEQKGGGRHTGLLGRVMSAATKAAAAQTVARINDASMREFVESGGVPLDKYRRVVSRVPLPLKFDDNAQEINFHSLIALLSFGGANEPRLLALAGSGAEDTVKFGLIGSHLSRERLDATWMKNAHVGSVSEAFKIPVREDTESSISGVKIDRPGALVSHAQALCSVLNDTGEALLSRGYSDLAQFIMHTSKSDPGAEGLVKSLSGALPAFRDMETVDGIEVPMLKNAQVLAGELCARMGSTVEGLHFKDIGELSAVADADVITALIFLRIVEPEKSSSVGSGISNGSQEAPTAAAASVAAKVFKPQDTAALRTVAVEACRRLANMLGDEFHPHELSLFLKRLSRRKEYKELARFVPEWSTTA